MKAPAFQFYAAEYLADEHVQLMTLEEEGAYIRLLAFCWREGSIPSDLNALSRLCKGGSTTLLAVVVKRFQPSTNHGDRLIHPRLEAERLKQLKWREKSAQGGKASAGKRKQRKVISTEQGGTTTVPPTRLKQKATLQSSSSVSSSSSEGNSKPRDARLDHPALRAVRDVRGSFPVKDIWDLVIETVGESPDALKLKDCWRRWIAKGYSPKNYGWLVDWYVESRDSNSNGKGRALDDSDLDRMGV